MRLLWAAIACSLLVGADAQGHPNRLHNRVFSPRPVFGRFGTGTVGHLPVGSAHFLGTPRRHPRNPVVHERVVSKPPSDVVDKPVVPDMPSSPKAVAPKSPPTSAFFPTETEPGLLTFPESEWDDRVRYFAADKEISFLPANYTDIINIPPPPGLKETLDEVQTIIKLKGAREAWKQDIKNEINDYFGPFRRKVGVDFESDPTVKDFLERVFVDVSIAVVHYKTKYNRARPKQYSKEINQIISPPGHPAYPSGHSTQANGVALAITQLLPEELAGQGNYIMGLAHQVALNREIGGVHYKSDSAAGAMLAMQAIALMEENPEYRALREEARAAFKKLVDEA